MAALAHRQEHREQEGRSSARLGSVRPLSLRFGEALALPAAVLPDLPVPPAIGLHIPSVPGIVRLALDPQKAEPRDGELVIDAGEWRAIVAGAEADRLWPASFVAFCARKRDEPSWRIEAEIALAGAQPDPNECWSVSRVLRRIGAEVVSIDLE
jgi:hypothetical protein